MLISLKYSSRSILKTSYEFAAKTSVLYYKAEKNFTTSKTKKSPFVNPAHYKPISNEVGSEQQKKFSDALSSEMKDAFIKQNESALANEISKRSTIDSLFVLIAKNMNHSLSLTSYKGIMGFVDQQINSLANELANAIDEESYRRGIKLCAIYLMVNYKNTSDKALHFTVVNELADAFLKGNIEQKALDELYRDALMNLVHILAFIQTNIISGAELKYPLDLIAESLLQAARSKDFYLDYHVQLSKKAGFKISEKTSKHLRWVNYLLTLSLGTGKPSVRLVQLARHFLQNEEFLIRIFESEKHYELPLRTMVTLISYSRITWGAPSTEFSDLTEITLENLASNIHSVPISKLPHLSDTFQHFGIFSSQTPIYHKFWLNFLDNLTLKKDEFSLRQWSTLIYYVGSSGFMTPSFLEKVFYPKLDPNNYSVHTKHPDFQKYLVNLLQAGLKNKFITVNDFYKHKEVLLRLFAGNQLGLNHEKRKIYLQLCNTMCRSDIFDYELWEPFFNNITHLMAAEGNSSFKIKYIYEHINLYAEDPELKKNSTTVEAFAALAKKHRNLRELLGIPVGKFAKENISEPKEKIFELFKQSNIKFTSHTTIGNLRVRCLIPDQKLVIEIYGYRNYIKPSMEKTLITEYGERVIKQLGYKLLAIPLMNVTGKHHNISPELELFRQLEDFYPIDG